MNQLANSLSLPQVAALIRATPRTLHNELSVVADEIQGWKPAPNEWCINEVIGHMIEADRRGFDGRIRTILQNDRPQLEAWDPGAVAASRRDRERDLFVLLDEMEMQRAESAKLIEQLTPDQLRWAGLHPQVGELRVADLLHEWVYHDRMHLKQILSNIQAFVWPNMGNAQKFSQVFQVD